MIFLNIALVVLTIYRTALYSLFFQQEEYDGKRFLKLVFHKLRLVDKKLSACLLVVFATSFVVKGFNFYHEIMALIMIVFAMFDRNSIKNAKKALALTIRLRRILFVTFGFSFVSLFLSLNYLNDYGVFAYLQILPFMLVLGNLALSPLENHIQKKIVKEATEKLKEINPIVIGITGSYGKTSVKHILSHILAFVTPCLHTPGSVNTMMGISRVIREKLNSNHKYFLVEMGAYGVGSIKRLCDFVNPKHGILTAVGNAHYERFKSIEKVAEAKFELSQAVSGVFAINGYMVKDEFISKYGKDSDVVLGKDLSIIDKKTTTEGIEFNILYKGETYNIKAPLFGIHHVENIALAILFAIKLGINIDVITEAVKTLPQITHRLEVIKNGDITYLDDAYNSNPFGFKSALEVLKVFKMAGRRTILVTPGMVELGDMHDTAHEEVGKMANDCADVTLVVSPLRIPSFVKEVKGAISFDNFKLAKEWIKENAKSGDVILFENDLPDLYENKTTL